MVASVFAHTGHMTKEEAREVSGLEESHFEEVFDQAGKVAEKIMKAEGNKADKVLEHFAEMFDKYTNEFTAYFRAF
jgi:hypothetical protein